MARVSCWLHARALSVVASVATSIRMDIVKAVVCATWRISQCRRRASISTGSLAPNDSRMNTAERSLSLSSWVLLERDIVYIGSANV
jgi:hypothetical protein